MSSLLAGRRGQGFITFLFIYILSAAPVAVYGKPSTKGATVKHRARSWEMLAPSAMSSHDEYKIIQHHVKQSRHSSAHGKSTNLLSLKSQPLVDDIPDHFDHLSSRTQTMQTIRAGVDASTASTEDELEITLTDVYYLDIAIVSMLVLVTCMAFCFAKRSDVKPASVQGKAEVIKNQYLLNFCRVIVEHPSLALLVVATCLLSSCIIGRHYEPLKNRALKLPPFDTKLKDVHVKMQQGFPSNPRNLIYGTVMIWSDENNLLANPASFTESIAHVDKLLTIRKKSDPSCASMEWYQESMPGMTDQEFMESGNDAVLVRLTLKDRWMASAIGKRIDCFVGVQDTLSQVDGKSGGLHVAMVSDNAVVDASVQQCISETFKHMLMSAPIMLALLMLGVGTPVRASTAFLCSGASIASMRASLVLIKWCWRDLNFTGPDTTVQFVMLALCFDYALFFWTRFAVERRKFPQDTVANAAYTSLTTAGYVIMLSSLVLVVSMSVPCFQPNANNLAYSGMALQFMTGIVFVSLYSLLIPPILAIQFPTLFDEPSSQGFLKAFSDWVRENITVRPWWIKRVGETITRSPWMYLVPFGVFALLVPLLVTLGTLELSYDTLRSVASEVVPEFHAHKVYADKFDVDRLNTVSVFLEAVPMTGMPLSATDNDFETAVTLSSTFGDATCRFVQSVLEETRGESYAIHATDVETLWWDSKKGACLKSPGTERQLLLTNDGMGQMLLLYKSATGKDAEALTRRFWDTIEPQASEILDIGNKRYRFRATLDSAVAEEMLLEKKVQETFPWIVFFTMIAVCCLVGSSFGSAFIAVKLVFTVFIPLIAEYGLLIGVYQHGWLECIGIKAIPGGIPWPILFVTCPLLFALAMDYDMFLFVRVYELRLDGYDNRSAVRIGLEETGPPITLAGSLMVVAFYFIFLTSVPILSIIGCLYMFGVAIDTYVVRLWIAPAALCMFETMNYWPLQVPKAVKFYEDYETYPGLLPAVGG